eukprot:1366986-Rhodomonas_salina.1
MRAKSGKINPERAPSRAEQPGSELSRARSRGNKPDFQLVQARFRARVSRIWGLQPDLGKRTWASMQARE